MSWAPETLMDSATPDVTLRTDHPLVGATLLDFDALLAEASPQLRALLERAHELAHGRIAAARAINEAIVAYEAAPFVEHTATLPPPALEAITSTDLCRALIAAHPELWAGLEIPQEPVRELSQRWRVGPGHASSLLPLQPALARRLTWARTLRPLFEPEDLFNAIDTDAVAPLAEHHEHHREGLITSAEAIFRLLRDRAEGWLGPLPAPYVDLGALDELYDLVCSSTRASPVIIVRGEPGSGRYALTRALVPALRRSELFSGWGFNVDNYHGGFIDPEHAPAFLALSNCCVASYGTEDLELTEVLVKSTCHRPEDTRLILRLSADDHADLARRLPEVAQAPCLELPVPDMRARIAALVAHMVTLNDWFRVDWGLPEAIIIARQTRELDSLAVVLACADQALAQQLSTQAYDLACARSNMQLPEPWLFTTEQADPAHTHARAVIEAPNWRKLRPQRCRRLARHFASEQPQLHAALVELAVSLHLRT